MTTTTTTWRTDVPLTRLSLEDIACSRRRPPVDTSGSHLRFAPEEAPVEDDVLMASFATVEGDASAWSRAGSSPPPTPRDDTFPAAKRAYYRRGDIRPRYMRIIFVLLIVVMLIGTYPTDRAQELKEIRELYGVADPSAKPNRTQTKAIAKEKPRGKRQASARTASPHRLTGEGTVTRGVIAPGL